jgi:hypothetical protein
VGAARVVAVAAACVAGVALVAAWFVLAERWVHFWDSAGYWRATADLADRIRHDVLGALGTVARTVRRDDYNLSPVLALAPPAILFGPGRLAYVLSIVLVYGLAAVARVAWFAERAVLRPLGFSTSAVVLAVAAVALLPAFWLPVLVGLPDVVGCAVLPWIWWLVRPPLAAVPVRRLLGAGALLALLVVLRRWYAFWGIGLLVALAIETAWRARRRDALVAEWTRLGVLAAAAAVAFFVATGAHGVAMLRTDYRDLHTAYRSVAPLRTAGERLLLYVGPGWLACAAAGAALALRSPATRPVARLLLLQSAAIVLLFTRTQNFASHHLYLLLPQLQLFAAVAVARLADLRVAGARGVAIGAMALFVAVAFAHAVVPGVPRLLGPASTLFGAATYPPPRRDDLDEVARLVTTLDELTRARHDRVYVLSSSTVLNDDLLRNAHLALPSLPELGDRIVATAHVDRRDGFPWALAQARYVVVTEPVGFHLDPEDQRVVGVPAREIVAGSTIGRSFARLPLSFALDGGTTAYVYARSRELPQDEIDALLGSLRAAYPGNAAFAGR